MGRWQFQAQLNAHGLAFSHHLLRRIAHPVDQGLIVLQASVVRLCLQGDVHFGGQFVEFLGFVGQQFFDLLGVTGQGLVLPGLAQMTFELAEQLARIALDDVERSGVRAGAG